MSYTYIRREMTSEELAVLVISSAHSFAETFSREGPSPKGIQGRNFLPMLARFERGDVLDQRDDTCLEAVGRALIKDVEGIVPGYSNIVLQGDASEDVFLNKELERCCDRLKQWNDFQAARRRLRSRIQARKIIEGM